MATLPAWNIRAFGCLRADSTLASLMRTVVTTTHPVPLATRRADTQAPLELEYALDMSDDGFRAWQQWTTYDLADGVLPFTIYIPWGTRQPRVRARLAGPWSAQRQDADRWAVTGTMELERESLPRSSGGAYA